ncbi:FAD:protein FMN transferase [Patescibacteria group bacterium]|nr:FAD:protein FMN transferase [Patescibacteria group bacterium]
MHHTRSIMGMPVILEIVDGTDTQVIIDRIFNYFISIDDRFSTYKSESEISEINKGVVASVTYSDEMSEVLRLAEQTREETGGYFDIHTPGGQLDPSGIVKGWAINNAAKLLRDGGHAHFYLEIAGDIQTSGRNGEGEEWSIGIRNPFNHAEIVKVLYPHEKGVATSGNYIRGNHVYNPLFPTQVPNDFVSLTVIGPNVYEADRFATAAFAMEKEGLYFLEHQDDFEGYAIDANGIATMTTGLEKYTKSYTKV